MYGDKDETDVGSAEMVDEEDRKMLEVLVNDTVPEAVTEPVGSSSVGLVDVA
jgi:hypothetical protein